VISIHWRAGSISSRNFIPLFAIPGAPQAAGLLIPNDHSLPPLAME
jgi:hypothetical protein